MPTDHDHEMRKNPRVQSVYDEITRAWGNGNNEALEAASIHFTNLIGEIKSREGSPEFSVARQFAIEGWYIKALFLNGSTISGTLAHDDGSEFAISESASEGYASFDRRNKQGSKKADVHLAKYSVLQHLRHLTEENGLGTLHSRSITL